MHTCKKAQIISTTPVTTVHCCTYVLIRYYRHSLIFVSWLQKSKLETKPILMIFTSTGSKISRNLYVYCFFTIIRPLQVKKALSNPLFFYLMLQATSWFEKKFLACMKQLRSVCNTGFYIVRKDSYSTNEKFSIQFIFLLFLLQKTNSLRLL